MELEKIEFNEDIILKTKIQSINKYPIHWHENITEIILPIKGSVEIKANFEQILLKEGDFFFINNKTIHSIRSENEAIVIVFYINLEHFQEQFPYIKNMFFRNSITEELLGTSGVDPQIREKFKIHFRNLLISIFLEKYNKSISKAIFGKLIHKLVYQMIYEFNWLQLLKNDGNFISSVHLDRYHRIVKYIDENYSHKINLDDIVSMEFITKTYFSHFWKNLSTYSFGERINYERVLKSEFLLFQNMTISDISHECGFSDSKYYYRNFKKWYGCMPLEHREKCNLYASEGYRYEELNFSDLDIILEHYMEKFFILNNAMNDDADFSTLIDKYLYLKYYHTIHKENPSTTKYLVLDAFKYATFNENNKDIKFDWTTIDLLMNLVIDFKFTLQIKLNRDKIRRDFIHDYIIIFMERIIARYGFEFIKDSHFLINYRDSLVFDNDQTIEEIITNKIRDVNITYYIEP